MHTSALCQEKATFADTHKSVNFLMYYCIMGLASWSGNIEFWGDAPKGLSKVHTGIEGEIPGPWCCAGLDITHWDISMVSTAFWLYLLVITMVAEPVSGAHMNHTTKLFLPSQYWGQLDSICDFPTLLLCFLHMDMIAAFDVDFVISTVTWLPVW